MREQWLRSDNEMHRLAQGGITNEVIDAAISSFVMETIVKKGEAADVLCNKDPLAFKQGVYLSTIFPKSKWLFMVRDGRAVIHSVIKRSEKSTILYKTETYVSGTSPSQATIMMILEAVCKSGTLSWSR